MFQVTGCKSTLKSLSPICAYDHMVGCPWCLCALELNQGFQLLIEPAWFGFGVNCQPNCFIVVICLCWPFEPSVHSFIWFMCQQKWSNSNLIQLFDIVFCSQQDTAKVIQGVIQKNPESLNFNVIAISKKS